MIKKIRVMLEYNTYCLWLYNEDDEIIDNDNPPEWDEDEKLTNLFTAVSDIYDTFFIDTKKEFTYVGCPNAETKDKLKKAFADAMDYLEEKNDGKYLIQNDVDIDKMIVNNHIS